jgi:hypothetical protein
MECLDIKDEWVLWFHSINDSKWDKSSYKELFKLKDLCDVYVVIDVFKQNHYQNGMFFLMKKGIFPNWEDPNNRLGGCLSFKISSSNVINEWNNLYLNCILENLLSENNDKINGISISPKKEFNILKLWFSETIDYKKEFVEKENTEITLSNSIYKKHIVEN